MGSLIPNQQMFDLLSADADEMYEYDFLIETMSFGKKDVQEKCPVIQSRQHQKYPLDNSVTNKF